MQNELNIITVGTLLRKNIKWLFGGALLVVAIATITLYLTPKYYKATATILPGNSLLQDKAITFNPNIKDLYSYFGNTDDIDRILAIANSDTVLLQVLHTPEIEPDFQEEPTTQLLEKFRKKLTLVKTDKDQLLISYYHTNPTLAASVANSIADKTNKHLLNLVKKEQTSITQNLTKSIKRFKQEYDSLSKQPSSALVDSRMGTLLSEINQYQRSVDEYTLLNNQEPSFVQVVETANPNLAKSWPSIPITILLAAIVGFILASCIVILKNRN